MLCILCYYNMSLKQLQYEKCMPYNPTKIPFAEKIFTKSKKIFKFPIDKEIKVWYYIGVLRDGTLKRKEGNEMEDFNEKLERFGEMCHHLTKALLEFLTVLSVVELIIRQVLTILGLFG